MTKADAGTGAVEAEDSEGVDATVDHAALVATDEGGADGEAAQEAQASKPRNAREEAVAHYRRLRDERLRAAESADSDASDDAAAAATPAEQPAQAAAPAAPAAPAASKPADEPTHTLVVDGKPVTMKLSEVIAKAQIAVASDNRLEEAKRLLAEAKALRSQAPSPENQPDGTQGKTGQAEADPPTDQSRANQPKIALDRERLKQIVARIQVGDDEEGAEAAHELAAEIAAAVAQPRDTTDIAKVVDEQMARRQLVNEINAASDQFKATYASIVQDQDMLDMSFARLRSKVRDDLVQAGLDAGQLQRLTQDQLFELHQRQRMAGGKVRDYGSLFNEVGREISEKYKAVLSPAETPAAAPAKEQKPTAVASPIVRTIADRIERKRSAPTQPRAAGVRTPGAEVKGPKDYNAIVADLRRARGFST